MKGGSGISARAHLLAISQVGVSGRTLTFCTRVLLESRKLLMKGIFQFSSGVRRPRRGDIASRDPGCLIKKEESKPSLIKRLLIPYTKCAPTSGSNSKFRARYRPCVRCNMRLDAEFSQVLGYYMQPTFSLCAQAYIDRLRNSLLTSAFKRRSNVACTASERFK